MKKYAPKEIFGLIIVSAGVAFYIYVHVGHHIFKKPAHAQNCGTTKATLHEISVLDTSFVPNELTITVCDTVRFVNNGQNLHEPAAGPHPDHHHYPEFDAKRPLKPQATYELKVNRIGTFSFHDHNYPEIKGELVVRNK